MRSNWRSVCVSTFCEMPSMRRSSSPLRIGRCASAGRINITHLPEISASASRAEHLLE
ncbi:MULTISPECIES: hypothetical protein [Serratia]|uniref:hypothetical protein n=1 Tax=Serratia TaxID=613 RepID=UPI001E2E7AD2|nr:MULTISPECIES: hypothetical protein [Serratia]